MKVDVSVLDAAHYDKKKKKDAMGIVSELKVQQFPLPNVENIRDFQKSATERFKPWHGTTTLAFVFQGGVLIAVDSRATQGSYIASQTVQKVIEINSFLLGTMAGTAADCSYWERYLGMKARLYELDNGKKISVRAASKLLADISFRYRGTGLGMGTMLAGWDTSGPSLFYVDSEAQRTQGKVFSVGSGCLYAYGVLDAGYRWDLTVEEAIDLGKRSIYHATFRDTMSGGTVSIYHVTKDGWTKISGTDVAELHELYATETAPDLIYHRDFLPLHVVSNCHNLPHASSVAIYLGEKSDQCHRRVARVILSISY